VIRPSGILKANTLCENPSEHFNDCPCTGPRWTIAQYQLLK
jgi:hypothetical protein